MPLLALAPIAAMLSGCSAGVEPWAMSFGDEAEQSVSPIGVDANGNVALAGWFLGQIDLGGGPLQVDDVPGKTDVYVASLDAAGQHRWSRVAGGEGDQVTAGAAFDADGNTIVLGGFSESLDLGVGDEMEALSHDIFAASFGPIGEGVWAKHFSADLGGPTGGGMSIPSRVIAGGDGGIFIGGGFSGTLGFGGPPIDAPEGSMFNAFVAKLDHRGDQVFAMRFDVADELVSDMAVDALGALTVAGVSGRFLTGSAVGLHPPGGFVARLSPGGSLVWSIPITGTDESPPDVNAVAIGAGGAAFVGGCFGGSLHVGKEEAHARTEKDGYVVQLDPSGALVSLATLEGACVLALAVDAGGHVHAGGQYTGAPDLGAGPLPRRSVAAAFVAELAPAGRVVGTRAFGHDGDASVVTSLAAVDDGLVMAGTFEGTFDVAPHPLTSRGATDIFVARLR
ncbi:Hypothetical protein A7982_01626 [Minicystis rosea]|nr:Hypothetical protein A7982_01626 [Minicystis rosea]